ncbi:MAG: 4'-phosphopantetheinyl transferase superfamily protein [Bacteroidota bacterium]
MTVEIAIAGNRDELSTDQFHSLSASLMIGLQQDFTRFRKWEDRQAALLGKLLLQQLLVNEWGNDGEVWQLTYDRYRRPYIANVGDFNISHTRGLVVCAFAKEGRVGVDVEKEQAIDLPAFRRVFTPVEYATIKHSNDLKSAFFHFWTKKEAIMKADGRGFFLDPSTIDAIPDEVSIDENKWYTEKLSLLEGCAGHLATSAPLSGIEYTFISPASFV